MDASLTSKEESNLDGDQQHQGKSRKELDEEVKKFRSTPWLRGRLALSEQAARYELPMDLLSLEKMRPDEYLRRFTRISAKRQQIYNKVFMNNKNKTSAIAFSELDKALGEVLITTFDKNKHLPLLLEITKLTEQIKIDNQLFSALCAFSERLLYPDFVTEDTENLPEMKRDHLEIADFQHLAWKLSTVDINPPMLKLLERINQKPLRIEGVPQPLKISRSIMQQPLPLLAAASQQVQEEAPGEAAGGEGGEEDEESEENENEDE